MTCNNIKVFEATEACAKCKGLCCKTMGCHYSPRDFKDLSFEGLKSEIEKGKISIDWWENDEPEFFLRARNNNAPIIDPSWGGVCVNLTPAGCSLSWEERPLGGKALRPNPDMKKDCDYTTYDKENCKNEWLEYSDILWKLYEYFIH